MAFLGDEMSIFLAPFVSSEVEIPVGNPQPHGVSTTLDTNGKVCGT